MKQRGHVVSPTEIRLDELMNLRFSAKGLSFLPHFQVQAQHVGHHLAKAYGRGMEFAEVRAYQTGDDVRAIDWRVTARRNQVHTKLYHVERDRSFFVVVDETPSMQFATKTCLKSVLAAHIATLLAFAAHYAGDKVGGFIASNDKILQSIQSGTMKGVLSFARMLSEIDFKNQATFAEHLFTKALQQCHLAAKTRATVLLISDFASADDYQFEKYLALLSRHNEVILCQVQDSIEVTAPPLGIYNITNGKEELTLDLSSHKKRDNFQAHLDQKKKRLTQLSHKYHCPLWKVATDDDLLHKIAEVSRG